MIYLYIKHDSKLQLEEKMCILIIGESIIRGAVLLTEAKTMFVFYLYLVAGN